MHVQMEPNSQTVCVRYDLLCPTQMWDFYIKRFFNHTSQTHVTPQTGGKFTSNRIKPLIITLHTFWLCVCDVSKYGMRRGHLYSGWEAIFLDGKRAGLKFKGMRTFLWGEGYLWKPTNLKNPQTQQQRRPADTTFLSEHIYSALSSKLK